MKKEEIEKNYLDLAEEISEIKKDIKICCVTKYSSPEEINIIIGLGAKIIGENKIQDAIKKIPKINPVEKHFIGHLQSNKVKKAIELFDVIQTIDSLKIAKKINKLTEKEFPIMIQVNIGKDKQKKGFLEEDLDTAIKEIKKLPKLKILGLMTIIPKTNEEKTRDYFRRMKKLNDSFEFKELSMGMSQDYKIAIEEGATIIRIGSAIFK
jgi:PLP dependent protein